MTFGLGGVWALWVLLMLHVDRSAFNAGKILTAIDVVHHTRRPRYD